MNLPRLVWATACVVITSAVIVGAIQSPKTLGIVLVVALAGWLMQKPFGRLVVFAAGSMAIFQSETLGLAVRAAFMAVLLVGLLPSLLSIAKAPILIAERMERFRRAILGLVVVFVFSLPFLLTNQVEISAWFRDATTYALIVIGAVFGLDAGLHTKSTTMRRVFAVIGVMGAFAFLVAWLDRRGVPLGGLTQFALSSSMIVVPVISMSLALYFGENRARRGIWAIIAVIQISMLLGSGGRSSAIILCALVGFVCLAVRQHQHSFRRLLGLLVTSAAVCYIALQVLISYIGETFLAGRFDWFRDISLDAIESDGSGQARLLAYDIMWQAFLESPLIGNGLGHVYPAVSETTRVNEVFTLDTPFVYLAKFGIIGTVILVGSLAGIILAGIGLTAKGSNARAQILLMCGATITAWIATLPSGAPTEQKGFGIGLAILVAMSVSWAREDSLPEKPPSITI